MGINPTLNLQPKILDLILYAGDGFKTRMTCVDSNNSVIDITGEVSAQIRVNRLNPDDVPIVEFDVNMTDAYLGIIILSLTAIDTLTLRDDPSTKSGKFTGVWDVEWLPDGDEPRTLCQGKVECYPDVTRPIV